MCRRYGWIAMFIMLAVVAAVSCGCKDKDKALLIDITAPTSSATPPGGHFPGPINVSLSATDDFDASPDMYYTVDGATTPTTVSSLYVDATGIQISTDTTLQWIAVDDWKNESTVYTEDYVIDTVIPTLSASLASGHYDTTQVMTYTGADDKSTPAQISIYYTIDGVTTPTTASTLYTAAVPVNTDTVLMAIAYDLAGNPSAVVTRDIVIDTVNPTATASVDSGHYDATFLVTLTPADDKSLPANIDIYYTTDGSDPDTGSTLYAAPVPIDVTTTLKFIAYDEVANPSIIYQRDYVIDLQAPVATVTDPAADDQHLRLTHQFEFTVTDPGDSYVDAVYVLCTDDNPAWQTATYSGAGDIWNYSIDTTGLSDGATDIEVYATDLAGNESIHVVRTFIVDNTDPSCGFTAPSNSDVINATTSIDGTSSDPAPGVLSTTELRIEDGGGGTVLDWTVVSGSPWYDWDTTAVSNGNYTLLVRATDQAGNTCTPVSISVTVDNTAPTTAHVNPSSGVWITGGAYLIQLSCTDTGAAGVANVYYQFDGTGGSWTATAYNGGSGYFEDTFDTNSLSDGSHDIYVYSVDTVGNTEAAHAISFNVDNEVPTCSIDDPATNGDWVTGTHTITISATDLYSGVAGAYVRIDAGGWTPMMDAGGGQYTYGWDTTVETAGNHTISVYVQDNVGLNNQSGPVQRTCNVDNDQPTIGNVASPTDNQWINGNPFVISITGVSDGAGSGIDQVLVSINGGTSTAATDIGGGNYTYNWNTLTASDGPNTIEVWAFDDVGILSSVYTRNCRVDNTHPNSYCSSPGNGSVTKNVTELRVYATDGTGCGINSVYVACSDGTNWLNAAGDAFNQGAETFHLCIPAGGNDYTFTTNSGVWTDGFTYWVKTYAVDNLSNTESPGTVTTFTINNAVPLVSINNVSSDTVGPALTSTINWESDLDGIYQVNVGGDGTWGSGTLIASGAYAAATPVDIVIDDTDIADDTTETVWVIVDATGNIGNNSTLIHDDETPPSDPAANPTGGPQTVPINVELTVTDDWDASPKIYYTEDGTDPDSGEPEYTALISISSNTTLRFIAYDAGGNTSGIVEEVYVYDALPPTTTINAPSPGLWINGTYVVDLTVVDNGTGTVDEVWVQVVGYGAFEATNVGGNNWTYSLDTTLYPDGNRTIQCWGIDDSNNVETPGPSVSVNFDNADPTSTCTSPAESSWTNSTPVLVISGDCDDGSGVGVTQVWVNPGGAGWVQADVTGGTTWSFDWNNPPQGTGTSITYYAEDSLGNTESPSNTRNFNIDYSPPSSWASPGGGVYMVAQNVDLFANDTYDGSPSIYYTIDGSDPKSFGILYTGSPINISTSTTLKFYAVDVAVNEEDVNTEDYIIGDPPYFNGAWPNWSGIRTGTNIYLQFTDQPMDRTSVENNFTVTKFGGGAVSGTFYWRTRVSDGVEICTFVPDSYLDDESTYDCDFTSTPTSTLGIPLQNFNPFSFDTMDCTAPVVTGRDPYVNEVVTSPAAKRSLTVQFNETISDAYLWLEDSTADEDIFDGNTWESALSITGAATDTLVLNFDMVYDDENIDDVNDDSEQLEDWEIDNAEKGGNTDVSGKLYVTILDNAGEYTVRVYKDAARNPAQLVAEGSSTNTQGWVQLNEENSSGLQGGVYMEYSTDDSDIELPIPFFEIEPGKAYEVGMNAQDNSWNFVEDEWVFYGQGNVETDKPEVIDSLPANTAGGISPRRLLYIILSEPIDASSFGTGDLTIVDGAGAATYRYQVQGSMIALYPDRALSGGVTVTLAANSIYDIAPSQNTGPSTNFVLTYTAVADTTDPVISWVLPASGTVDIDKWNFRGGVMFTERMGDQLPAGALTVVEADSGAPIKGVILRPRDIFDTDLGGVSVIGIETESRYAGLVYWEEAVTFNITLSASIADPSGNTLGTAYTWPVTTVVSYEDDISPTVGGQWAFDENLWIDLYANGNAIFWIETQAWDDMTQEQDRGQQIGTGDDSQVTWATTLAYFPVQPNSVWCNADGMNAQDDGWGNISGGGATGTIDYVTGDLSITWPAPPGNSQPVNVNYREKGSVCFEVIGTGDGSATHLSGFLSTTPVAMESLNLRTVDTGDGTMQAWASEDGEIYGDVVENWEDGQSYINYETGEYEIFWRNPVKIAEDVIARYETGLDVTVTNGVSTWTLIPSQWGSYEYESPEKESERDMGIPGMLSDPQWEGNENYGWNTFTFTIKDEGGHTVTFTKSVYIPNPATNPGPVPTYPDTGDATTDPTPTFTWNAHSIPMECIFTFMWLGQMTDEEPQDIGEWIFGSATSFTLPDSLALSPDLYLWVTVSEVENAGGDYVMVAGVNHMFEKAFWVYNPALGSISGTISPHFTVIEREITYAALFTSWPPSGEPYIFLPIKYNIGPPDNWTYAIYNIPDGTYYAFGLMEIVEPMGPDSGDAAGAYPNMSTPTALTVSGGTDWINIDFLLYPVP